MQQYQLLVQSALDRTFTIILGQTPVIDIGTTNPLPELTATANFLRSGCPSVQLLYPGMSIDDETAENVAKILKKLTLPGEIFSIKGDVKSHSGDVQIVTRHVTDS